MRYALLVLLMGSTAFGEFTASKGLLPISSGNGYQVERGQLPEINWCTDPVRRPVVKMYTATWCGWCTVAKNNLTPGVRADLPFDVILVDTDSSNEYSGSIPAFRWETPTGIRTVGWSSWNAIKDDWERTAIPTPSPKAIRQTNGRLTPTELKEFARTYNGLPYGVRGSNFYGHLLSGNHGFTAQQLQGLTQDECAKIHAGHHWGYLTPFSIGGK